MFLSPITRVEVSAAVGPVIPAPTNGEMRTRKAHCAFSLCMGRPRI